MPETQAAQCWTCPPGWYCVGGFQHHCPAGFYCPEGTGYGWRACPVGTYSPQTGLSERSQCIECDGGSYCALPNATSVTGLCVHGYYCLRGSTTPQPNSSGEGGQCPPGHFCPQGTTHPKACPEGTFSNRSKLTSQAGCSLCTPGHYCSSTGLTVPSGECWEGFYCLQGAVVPNSPVQESWGGPCPAGHYCHRGTATPRGCPAGSISVTEGQSRCSICLPGYYCPGNSSSYEDRECPTGYYCPAGTIAKYQYPCPAGTINPYLRSGDLTGCVPCPPGFYCTSAGQGETSGPCAAGHFCYLGSNSPKPEDGLTGDKCPPGHFCPQGVSAPHPCPVGYYSSQAGNTDLSNCLPCPSGFSCTSRGLSIPSDQCRAGFYCTEDESIHSGPQTCSPGHMCPAGSSAQIPCVPGTYQSQPGQAVCVHCPAGFYCAGSVNPVTEDTEGTHTPAPCPKGHFCPPGTKSGMEFPCPAGTYSDQEGIANNSQCTPCPPGQYCSAAGLTDPTGDCSPGFVCIQGSIQSQPPGDQTGGRCPAGFYCMSGSSHAQPCPPGTFSSLEGAISVEACHLCPPGQYCADYGLQTPSGPCSPGFFCTQGASNSTPRFNSTELETFSWSQVIGGVCPRGHFCPRGSAQPVPCPPGTFLGRIAAQSETDCILCSPGFYCPDWAQTSVLLPCPGGWFCPAGSSSGHQPDCQCTPGNACPVGSVGPTACPAGTYQSLPLQYVCLQCPPAFFCEEGTSVPRPCPPGTVGKTKGLGLQQDCATCPPGFYCNSSALIEPSGPCSAGHFCTSGAVEPNPVSQPFGDICPPGHYCKQQSASPIPCPSGSFLQNKGAQSHTECTHCPPGMYCLTPGSSLPSGFCSPGYYCVEGADTARPINSAFLVYCLCEFVPETMLSEFHFCCGSHNATCLIHTSDMPPFPTVPEPAQKLVVTQCANFKGDICPKGFYCPLGSALPLSCDAGSYCNSTGLHMPTGPCDAGYYCPKGSSEPFPNTCPIGHYCPQGTLHPRPCPIGTVKGTSGGSALYDCLSCPPGYFCDHAGLVHPSGLCSVGYYCPGGQTSATPMEHLCKAGHFCEEGSVSERPCLPGTYQTIQGQHHCEPCPPGFYCSEEGMEQPMMCHAGFFCPIGTAFPQPCPPGSYGNLSGLTDELECTSCDPGMYCKGSGNISPTGPCSSGFMCFGGAPLPASADGITGATCPIGFYCPSGSYTATPCPKGTFSEKQGLIGPGECQSCTAGFYCAEPGRTHVSGPCLAGFYCLEGSSDMAPFQASYGDQCPSGHYCENATAFPSPCPAGTHRPEHGGQERQDCVPCPYGWFQNQRGQRDCKLCPAGYHCPLTTQDITGAAMPLLCPQGYFCPSNVSQAKPLPCPKGTFGLTNGLTAADECTPCSFGHFCGSEGLSQPSGTCSPGFLCLVRAEVPNPTDNRTGALCPPGAFCQMGVIAGDCSPGYFCSWGSSSAEEAPCPVGAFCPRGATTPVLCETGTFASATGNSHRGNCSSCPAGFVCQGQGTVQPKLCPQGHYCPSATSVPTQYPCPAGTLRHLPGASSPLDCQPCPAGMFCAHPGLSEPSGLCGKGYLCRSGASSPNGTDNSMSVEDNICPVGHYCPAGTGVPLPCPPGTFSSSRGLWNALQCQSCPPGHFCEHEAMVLPSQAVPCAAGYVCLGESISPRPIDRITGYLCPRGYSCPLGSAVERPCEPGTYSLNPGSATCIICPSGTMCLLPATEEPLVCPEGHFCPAGTTFPEPCPMGTVGDRTGARSVSDCVPCPTGFYCSVPGASEPQGQCQAGYFCQSGATSPAPQNSTELARNGPCPVGSFCPLGSLSPLSCPTGTIRNITGGVSEHSCFPCPAGYYCDGEAQVSPSGPCAAGFYCPSDYSSTSPQAFLCSKGHFCPPGSSMAVPCPTGQYQPNPGSDSCIPCRPGFYCEEAIIGDPWPCPPHSFCPAGTMVPLLCPNGTFTPPDHGGLQDERECLPCPSGRYCRSGKIQGNCAAGYLCISGSPEPTPQASNEMTNGTLCQWGVQCAGLCPAGFYCAEGTEKAKPCPENTLRSLAGAGSESDCLPCPPKYWCRLGHPIPNMCPVGHYCDGIADTASDGPPGPKKCPPFTYRPLPGAGNKGECLRCPSGTYCNSTGLTDLSGFSCPSGFWCTGSGPPVPCPAGTMRAQPGAAAPSDCEPCPPGYFCPDPRSTGHSKTAGIPCRPSYQCPKGSVEEMLCTAGYYCGPQTGEPKKCPAGYFCPEGSYTYNTPQQVCLFPYFCSVGSSTPLPCSGGFLPLNTSGLRDSELSGCAPCLAGTYRPAEVSELNCLPCPPGYHCPAGTEHYSRNLCPLGYVCPKGSARPVPCPPGYYGNHTGAKLLEDCHQCPAGTFNNLPAQSACFPCGSSASSETGSSSCSCIGKNRAFQQSDGSCVCKAGFVFYNQMDFKSTSMDSDLDCQPEVRIWHFPYCHCEQYVSVEELCDAVCLSHLPLITASRSSDSHLMIRINALDESRLRSRVE
ncbi:zonadhesin [Denticeps clupeoides]|uniref:zonadhesin n=1 Tax=Denticeps clupeoides TaxID=299321 RepID=UPI0010A3F56D|nr:zonadhesin-like [Denticeps clupeoides]